MGHFDTVQHTVQLGAHPQGYGGMGKTRNNFPIRSACIYGHEDIVECLLANGAGPEKTIATASEWGRTALVRRLLEVGIASGNALFGASAGGYLAIVRLLLDAGVNPNEDAASKCAYANAIANEHTQMFNLLIERGADIPLEGVAEQCVERTKKEGLESMLMLLESHGVNTADAAMA